MNEGVDVSRYEDALKSLLKERRAPHGLGIFLLASRVKVLRGGDVVILEVPPGPAFERLNVDGPALVSIEAELSMRLGRRITLAAVAQTPEEVEPVEQAPDRAELLRTMDYRDYLRTAEWAVVRRLALDAGDYRCSVCDSRSLLEVHHRTYDNRGQETLRDVTVLCNVCHGLFHKNLRLRRD